MIKVLALIIPLGLAGAISPVLLTEQTVLLSGPGGRRAGRGFLLGAVIVLAVFVGALVLFGRSIKLPTEPHLSASIDVGIGAVLILLALWLFRRRPQEKADDKDASHTRSSNGFRDALAFGMFSMATNFTTLALAVPAAKEIAASQIEDAERAIVALVFILLASIPAWMPLALTRLAPQTGERALTSFGNFIQRNGRRASVVLLAGFGSYMLLRGIIRLAG